jgi:hypothetical protein
MPYDHPEPDDPQMLVGVLLPGDEHTTREMAYTFAEEFARMGYPCEQLLALFRNPYYGGVHGAYVTLGDDAIRAIVEECVAWFGPRRRAAREPTAGAHGVTPGHAPYARDASEGEKPDGAGCDLRTGTEER